MALFKRKKPTQQATTLQPAKPHVIEDMYDASREPSIIRRQWSDGRIDYVKPGDPYPQR